MPQPVQRLPAQVQPQPGSTLVLSPVSAGVALLKHPGQILRRNADAGVGNGQKLFFSIHRHGDGTAFRVFDGVGENLFHGEGKPFFVRQKRAGNRLVAEPQLFLNEQRRKPAQHLAQKRVQVAGAQHIVGGGSVHPGIVQGHIRILLHLKQFA